MRWLEDAEYVDDAREVFQPFSMGQRNCIGQSLAWAEMKLILARLVWTFDLELLNDKFNFEQQKGMILWLKPELNVRLRVRDI